MQELGCQFGNTKFANSRGNIAPMPIRMRPVDERARRNLELIIAACARRIGKSRGGQAYLARLLQTPYSHLSAIRYGKRNMKGLKDKLEHVLGLPSGWVEDEHDASVVSWLEPRIPLRPYPQKVSSPAKPASSALSDEDVRRIADALAARMGLKPNTRG